VVADGLISARFRLGELLGTGGTASVFAAVDVRDESSVALKILHPHLAADEGAREALFREARAAAGLRHPNIVTVLDTGVHDDSLAWISLELVAGTSLGEFVEVRGPLDVDEAVTLTRGILLALHAAHAAGIVHRDVSPANVMIATRPGARIAAGDVRLVDFGLADATGRPALSAGGDDAPAGVVGNVNYLSPEQAEGREIDARGDVYQLGAVIYFALTGRAPFERSTVVETMRAHVSSPPPVPSVRRSGVPRALDRLVVKAMLKQPRDRFQSAGEMLAALDALDALAPVAGGGEPRTMLLGAPTGTVALGAPATRTGSRAAAVRDQTTRLGAVGPPRRPASVVGPAATRAVAAPPAVEPPAPEQRSPVWAILGALVVVGIAVAWILSATTVAPPRRTVDRTVATPTASATSTRAPVAAVQQPQAVTVAVPDVSGGTVVTAAVVLDRAGLVLGSIAEENSAAAAGTVLRSSPEASSAQSPGTTVDVVVASGSNTVPATAGLPRDAAATAIQNAGFAVLFDEETDLLLPRGTVLRTEPADATSLVLGRPVLVVVATSPLPTATPTATPAPEPTPAPGSGG